MKHIYKTLPGIVQLVCLLWAIMGGATGPVFAQSAVTFPHKFTEYIAPDGSKLPGPEGAHHRNDYTYRDSLSGTIRVYDAAGKLQEITPYADLGSRIKLGPRTTFYDNGQLRSKEDFVGEKRQGEFLVYYPEGQLKRREIYEDNIRKSAACFARDGGPVAFYEYSIMPTYKGGGTQKMVQAIAANVRYPAAALQKQTQGRVFVSFKVAVNGLVEDVKVVKGVSTELDLAAISAVKKLSGFTPGQLDGELVPVSFTLPVTFSITEKH